MCPHLTRSKLSWVRRVFHGIQGWDRVLSCPSPPTCQCPLSDLGYQSTPCKAMSSTFSAARPLNLVAPQMSCPGCSGRIPTNPTCPELQALCWAPLSTGQGYRAHCKWRHGGLWSGGRGHLNAQIPQTMRESLNTSQPQDTAS